MVNCSHSITFDEYSALHSLYKTTNGMNWMWKSEILFGQPWIFNGTCVGNCLEKPCGDRWQGLQCTQSVTSQQCFISGIILSSYGLKGFISPSLANLSGLQILDLGVNYISGTIPLELGNLTNLVHFILDTNRLSGPLPSSLGALTRLTHLLLDTNCLSGPLPTSFGRLEKLENLYLSNNFLTGHLPTWPNASSLQHINIEYNNFEGTVPDTWGNLINVLELVLANNQFSQSIPPPLGKLVFLQNLNLANNLLEGAIPTTLEALQQLQYFYLENNFLSCTLPDIFDRMRKSLLSLDVSQNSLTGPLPPSITGLVTAYYLGLNSNQFTGKLSALDGLSSLQTLFAYTNKFTGNIPSVMSGFHRLRSLYLQDNNLGGDLGPLFMPSEGAPSRGVIPVSRPFPLLEALDVSQNAFSGIFPSSVFSLASLRVLSAGMNCFSGTLSVSTDTDPRRSVLSVIQLSGLSSSPSCRRYFFAQSTLLTDPGYVPNNFMEGTIPPALWALPNLTTLSLEGNGFRGTVDMQQFNASTAPLMNVSLSSNRLSGSVPLALQTFGRFQNLDLSYNKFSGTLSPLANFPSETTLNISANRISGPVPNVQAIFSDPLSIFARVLNGNLMAFTFGELGGRGGVGKQSHPEIESSLLLYSGSTQLNTAMATSCPMLLLWIVAVLAIHGALHPNSRWSRWNTCKWWPCAAVRDHPFVRLCGLWWRLIDSTAHNGYNECSAWSITSSHFFECEVGEILRLHEGVRNVIKAAAMTLACAASIALLLLVLKLSPLRHLYSTHAIQYSWTPSAAYLHGSAPTALLVVFALFATSIYVIYSLRGHRIQDHRHHHEMSHQTDNSRDSQMIWPLASFGRGAIDFFCLTVFLKIAMFMTVNVVVMLAMNFLYLRLLLENSPQLVAIQLSLAGFKFIWSSLYGSSTMMFLSGQKSNRQPQASTTNSDSVSNMSQEGSATDVDSGVLEAGADAYAYTYLQFLLLFNFIIAPCLATALSDSSCFYGVFKQQGATPSTYDVPCIGSYKKTIVDGHFVFTCESTTSQQFVPQSLATSTFFPPFQYSYQCGSALITNYVPVLLYSFILSGVVKPFLVILTMLYRDRIEAWSLPAPIKRVLFPSVYLLGEEALVARVAVVRRAHVSGGEGLVGTAKALNHSAIHSSLAAMHVGDQTFSENCLVGTDGVTTGHENSRGTACDLASAVEDNSTASGSRITRVSERATESAMQKISTHARFLVARLVLHLVVMLTFGLAAPCLSLVVLCSLISEAGVARLLQGYQLWESSVIVTGSLALGPPTATAIDGNSGHRDLNVPPSAGWSLESSTSAFAHFFVSARNDGLGGRDWQDERGCLENTKNEPFLSSSSLSSPSFGDGMQFRIRNADQLANLSMEEATIDPSPSGPPPCSGSSMQRMISHTKESSQFAVPNDSSKAQASIDMKQEWEFDISRDDLVATSVEMNNRLRGLWRLFHRSNVIVVAYTGLFWALLSFDMVGDTNGSKSAVGTFLVIIFCFPMLSYLVVRLFIAADFLI